MRADAGRAQSPPAAARRYAVLAEVVRHGRSVGLAGRDPEVYALVRAALVLLLDDSGGRA